MAINITNAVGVADLLVDDMFFTYANNYISPFCNFSIDNDIIKFNGVDERSYNACVVYSPRYDDYNPNNYVRVFNVKSDGNNYKYSDDHYSYDSKNPLKIMFVTNPAVSGAFATKIKDSNNALLTSGSLSGCSVAVLRKGKKEKMCILPMREHGQNMRLQRVFAIDKHTETKT
ncbi:MAG: hypothetical protein IKA80_08675 [Spirochaetaceae bacterium]|nr:hypothetical protein [Spirochaetaceae bacterium]